MGYDLLIKNGTVIDGTGASRRQADVAVKDGKIAEIGTIADGAAKTIDVDGCVVAPGFIDPHTHLRRADLLGSGDQPVPLARRHFRRHGQLRRRHRAVSAGGA